MFSLDKKKILIIGLGKTGISIINYALEVAGDNVEIRVTDSKNADKLSEDFHNIKDSLAKTTLGGHEKEDFDWADIIFASPGVDLSKLPFTPVFSKEVINDIELAFRMSSGNFVGITGSNGKSTTTKLIYELLYEVEKKSILCGNYGNPILDEMRKIEEIKYYVCELSSFQLENIIEFSPDTSLLLNFSEDHLDRYNTYKEYIKAKERIFINANPNTKIIYNLDDPLVKKSVTELNANKFSFSWTTEGDISSDSKYIFTTNDKLGKHKFSLENCKLIGRHHIENMMAAILTALLYKIPDNIIQRTIDNFVGIPHRTEFIRDLNGVTYYNDSKATNVGSTKKALESFGNNIILIAGGHDKGGALDELDELVKTRVKKLLLIGEAADRFFEHFKKLTYCIKCSNFAEAVVQSKKEAEAGDLVILSPICSSYDMFNNFEERGDYFKKLVLELS